MPRLNSVDSLFTAKLQRILDNPSMSKIITWGKNSYSIEIIDKKKLLEQILPKHFRQKRFESFVRQMNLYGFKKNRHTNKHCFVNSALKHGKKLIELKSKNQIKRQINQKKQKNHFPKVRELQNIDLKPCQKFSSQEKFDIKIELKKEEKTDENKFSKEIIYHQNDNLLMDNPYLIQYNPWQMYYGNYLQNMDQFMRMGFFYNWS